MSYNRNNNINFKRNYLPRFWSPLTSVPQQDIVLFTVSSDSCQCLKLHHILFSLQSSLCHLCVRAVILIFPGLVYAYEQYLHELLYLRAL